MKYLKRFLLGLGFLVGLNLLVVLVIWIQALIAVHQAREANADPAMPIEHHPVMTFPDFKHRSGGAGFWLDNDHLLIDGNVDGQVFGPTDLYVIDVRDGSKTLFHKSAFLMYQNEDGSLHLALTDRDPNHIWHVDVVNDRFIAREINSPFPNSEYSNEYTFQSPGGRLKFLNNHLFFQKNGKYYDTGLPENKTPIGASYEQLSGKIFIGTYESKRKNGFFTITSTGSLESHDYNALLSKYKVKHFAIAPLKSEILYYYLDNNGRSKNNGVFKPSGNILIKIWGRDDEDRNIEDLSVAPKGCRISIGFKGRDFDPKESGFEVMNVCD